jgi:hypothetical protein
MKEIRAKFNPNYGNAVVSQKYSPLSDIALSPNFAYFEKIINNRKKILGSVTSVKFTVLGQLPEANSCPFIVVSSNRSNWIADKFSHIRELEDVELDFDMFTPYDGGQSVLFYDPLRTKRPLIIFVHNLELTKYQESFSKLRSLESVVLVGWELSCQNNNTLLGFGASRFAAIELLKHIGVGRGWIVDDNVVHVQGLKALRFVEDHFKCVALGFGSATKNITENDLKKHDYNVQELNFAQTQLLQQVVLWDVRYLKENNINFSPYFISSNEDVSFSRFLGGGIYACTQCTVIKLEPNPDCEDSLFLRERKKQFLLLNSETEGYQIGNQSIRDIIPERLQNNKYVITSQMLEQIAVQNMATAKKQAKSIEELFVFKGIEVQVTVLSRETDKEANREANISR